MNRRIREVMVERMTKELESLLTEEEYYQVYEEIKEMSKEEKLFPYKAYKREDKLAHILDLESTEGTNSVLLFYRWLSVMTDNIEKEFNKGRKIARVMEELPFRQMSYNLKSEDVVLEMMLLYTRKATERIENGISLSILRKYLISVLLLWTTTNGHFEEEILRLFILESRVNFDSIIELGILKKQEIEER